MKRCSWVDVENKKTTSGFRLTRGTASRSRKPICSDSTAPGIVCSYGMPNTIRRWSSHRAAASITFTTSFGCDRNGTWLAPLISVVFAPIRFA